MLTTRDMMQEISMREKEELRQVTEVENGHRNAESGRSSGRR